MRAVIILIFLILSFFIKAQGGFRSRYVLPNAINNTSKTIFETSPGNYITGGIVYDSLNGYSFNHLVIMSLNSAGQMLWAKKYGRKNFEYLDNIYVARSFYKKGNSILYTGCVRDSNNKCSGVLIKFSLNGDTLWQKIYRDPLQDVIPQMLTASVDGGFLITGFFQDWVNNSSTCLLIKTDANGKELWRTEINKTAPNTEDGKAIIQDSVSKKIIIVGYQYIGGSSVYDNLIILDSLGSTSSHLHYSTGQIEDIIQTSDKKFVAVGCIFYGVPNSASLSYSHIFKFDINTPGQAIWRVNNFGKLTPSNYFNCVKELPNGDLLVAGSLDTNEALTGTLQVLNRISRFNSNGSLVSNRYYNYAVNDSAFNNIATLSLDLTSDGGWVTSNRIDNFNYPNPFLFVKYDSTGCDTTTQWCQSVALGVSQFNRSTGWDFNMFPNPTKDYVNFKIDAPQDKKFVIKINELSGRVIEELKVDSQRDVGLNVSDYKAGVYFVSVFYEGKSVETKKLVITR